MQSLLFANERQAPTLLPALPQTPTPNKIEIRAHREKGSQKMCSSRGLSRPKRVQYGPRCCPKLPQEKRPSSEVRHSVRARQQLSLAKRYAMQSRKHQSLLDTRILRVKIGSPTTCIPTWKHPGLKHQSPWHTPPLWILFSMNKHVRNEPLTQQDRLDVGLKLRSIESHPQRPYRAVRRDLHLQPGPEKWLPMVADQKRGSLRTIC